MASTSKPPPQIRAHGLSLFESSSYAFAGCLYSEWASKQLRSVRELGRWTSWSTSGELRGGPPRHEHDYFLVPSLSGASHILLSFTIQPGFRLHWICLLLFTSSYFLFYFQSQQIFNHLYLYLNIILFNRHLHIINISSKS